MCKLQVKLQVYEINQMIELIRSVLFVCLFAFLNSNTETANEKGWILTKLKKWNYQKA